MNSCLKDTPLPSDMSLWVKDAFGHDSSYDYTSDEASWFWGDSTNFFTTSREKIIIIIKANDIRFQSWVSL